MPIKITIVEDNSKDAESLKAAILKYGNESSQEFWIETFSDGWELLKKNNYGEIVFLDIDMPGINGIELARNIRKTNSSCIIVFVTNMAQYAINGYEVEARDYLLKPVSYDNFRIHFKRILMFLSNQTDDYITITANYSYVQLNVNDIIYVESSKHKIIYHTVKEDYSEWISMRELCQKMSEFGFVLCNPGCLVNVRFIESISGMDIKLKGSSQLIPISRSKKKEVLLSLANQID